MAYGPQGTFTADTWLNAYYHSEGGRNSSWVNDPVLDKMITDQHTELNPEKRKQILIDIQRYLLDEVYQAVIYSSLNQNGVWPWNMNRTLSAAGDYPAGRGQLLLDRPGHLRQVQLAGVPQTVSTPLAERGAPAAVVAAGAPRSFRLKVTVSFLIG